MVELQIKRVLSICPQTQGNSNPRRIWSQTAPDVYVYTARIDSGHTYKQPLGQLSDSMEPCALSYATQPHRGDNSFCQSRYELRKISQIGYSASIVKKKGSPYRSMARSARLANGINEVVAPPLANGRATSLLASRA